MKQSFLIAFLFLVCCLNALSQSRVTSRINDNWYFVKGDTAITSKWEQVSLPHTWNTTDAMDDIPDYYRGIGWYKRNINISKQLKDKAVSLFFEGANQETEVFVNGKKAGKHIGGYTGFNIQVEKLLKFGEQNEIVVKVDNSFNPSIAPLTADFTFYGGIYRDVYLITTNKIRFAGDHGSKGVYITTPVVSDRSAQVQSKSIVSNTSNKSVSFKILNDLFDASGKKVSESKMQILLKPGDIKSVQQKLPEIEFPKLWSPEEPYLYKVITKIVSHSGEIIDEISNQIGFRWFSFDADKGFFLNGKPYKLIGASRHQDYKNLGNAVSDELAIKDVELLKSMGANFLRVAHYPQDPSVMEACDSIGLLASVEIPVVNEITESDSFYRNCEQMQLEMIHQNFNHPSVIIWCYMNEVLLKTHHAGDKEKKQTYYNNIRQLAQRLENITRAEDPHRYTMMANHGNLEQYKIAGLLQIPMLIGWNLYSGWYGGSMDEFPNFLDDFHKSYPTIPFLVTEYGADADPRIRSTKPIRFDKSVEYTTKFHQFYLTEMLKRPYVSAAIVWNLADFGSETRTETMPHMNNKGLLEFDRTPKDPYFYYQAMLSKQPYIKILGASKVFGIADSVSSVCYQVLEVASNLDSLTIHLNGIAKHQSRVINGIAEWKLPFKEGSNIITVTGTGKEQSYQDTKQMSTHLLPQCLKNSEVPFKQMNVVLGTSRYYIDEDGNWWQPDRAYAKGEWGYVGGVAFKIKNNNRLPYGTDKNIIGTSNDPIYQTQQSGIKQYKLDVPSGEYELKLHFAELTGGGKISVPPYNLTDSSRTEKKLKRIFNVVINGKPLLRNFNIAEEYGVVTPVIKKAVIKVESEEGITIDFDAVEGEPVLNALQVKRLQ